MRSTFLVGVCAVTLGLALAIQARADDVIDIAAKRGDTSTFHAAAGQAADPVDLGGQRALTVSPILQGSAESAVAAGMASAPVTGRPLKLGTTVDGLDSKVRRAELANEDGWRNGAGILPPDLRAQPTTAGDPFAGGPSPVISARDRGGVVGLSYKINPR